MSTFRITVVVEDDAPSAMANAKALGEVMGFELEVPELEVPVPKDDFVARCIITRDKDGLPTGEYIWVAVPAVHRVTRHLDVDDRKELRFLPASTMILEDGAWRLIRPADWQ